MHDIHLCGVDDTTGSYRNLTCVTVANAAIVNIDDRRIKSTTGNVDFTIGIGIGLRGFDFTLDFDGAAILAVAEAAPALIVTGKYEARIGEGGIFFNSHGCSIVDNQMSAGNIVGAGK